MAEKRGLVGRRMREAMLNQQEGKCACCRVGIPSIDQAQHDVVVHKIVCKKVFALAIKGVRFAANHGLAYETLQTYLLQAPIALPNVKHKRTRQQIKSDSRYMAATGGLAMTLVEYDERFGTSGPVIDPDTGLEWVPPTTEDSPPDRLVVGGVLCEVQDGCWTPVEETD